MAYRLHPGRRVPLGIAEPIPQPRGELGGRGAGEATPDHEETLLEKVLDLI
jgi:hypothetical protein